MAEKKEPLTESYFYILLCLYGGPKHGYGIMQETAELSGGTVKIGSGTMYGATGNMLKKGWIVETQNPDPSDTRKRLYSLTDAGKDVLMSEVERLQRLLGAAQRIMNERLLI